MIRLTKIINYQDVKIMFIDSKSLVTNYEYINQQVHEDRYLYANVIT